MTDTVRLKRPVAPGDTVTVGDGRSALVLRLTPTEAAAEYEAAVTTATPSCSHCDDEQSLRHSSGDRWQCATCGRETGREELRDWAIGYMINLGRFSDPVGASDSEWEKWWDEWREEILADAAAAEALVHGP